MASKTTRMVVLCELYIERNIVEQYSPKNSKDLVTEKQLSTTVYEFLYWPDCQTFFVIVSSYFFFMQQQYIYCGENMFSPFQIACHFCRHFFQKFQ